MFIAQEYPVPHRDLLKRVEGTFVQKPARIPLEVPLYPTRLLVVKQETNWVPIVAIASIVTFFGFLAFLAFMRKS